MKVGITGTREGMNERQRSEVRQVLHDLAYEAGRDGIVPHFHHGDCVGVDVQAAEMAEEFGYVIVCHPPVKDDMRGFHRSHQFMPPKGYLERDSAIVDSVDVLLVVPKENEWQPKGGTWYTHDYAKKRGVPNSIFYPGVE
jgi:hypothetical protein